MRIAFVNQDRGISPDREKGAAVHLSALRKALARRGAKVLAFDQPDDSALLDELSRAWRDGPFDLVYERYALGKDTACRFAQTTEVPFALEVNSPLLVEASTYRDYQSCERDIACEDFLMQAADRIFAVSAAIGEYAASRGALRIEVCPNGVDADVFFPRPNSELRNSLIPKGRLVVGFHGRLRSWHGIEFLGHAIKQAIASGVPLHLLTVGRGDYEELLSPYIPRSHRTHVQWVPHDEVARYVGCFDVLPLCYQEPVYFSPLKLAEGMACGAVPVVPHGGDWERFLVQSDNALYYPAGSIENMAECFERLASAGGERNRLGASAIRTSATLSWDSIAERVMSVPARAASAEEASP